MISIQSRYNEAKVFTDKLDSGSEGLIRALCSSPLSQGSRIRIMPDVHAGRGSVVGTTMTLTDRVAPGLVGADIGCGILVYKIREKRVELQKLDKIIRHNIPSGSFIRSIPHRYADSVDLNRLRCGRHVQKDKARLSIGTLGGGNHFIELDRDSCGDFWLIIHSGSRNLGNEVARYYQDLAYQESKAEAPYELSWLTGASMDDYLHDMSVVMEFATYNRVAIADVIFRKMKLNVDNKDQFSSVHNYIDTEQMILRKGAVSAKQGERLIIPLNMRDGCLLCEGKGNPDWNLSAPHGAGRLMSRAEARQTFTFSQYKREMNGIYSTTILRDTLDECPMAYKPIDEIVPAIGETVRIVERIVPIYNYKGYMQ